jgi:hypothetical protein
VKEIKSRIIASKNIELQEYLQVKNLGTDSEKWEGNKFKLIKGGVDWFISHQLR